MIKIIKKIKLCKNGYNARRWIKFAVIPSFLPIVLVVLYDLYLGYTFRNIINRHLLDFTLIIFAISVSVFSSAMILYKKSKSMKNTEKGETRILITILIGLGCSAYFTIQYDGINLEDALSWGRIVSCLIHIIATFYLIYAGMMTEETLESMK